MKCVKELFSLNGSVITKSLITPNHQPPPIPIHKKVGQFLIKTGWRGAPLAFCNLANAFKHNTIRDSNGIQTHNHLVRKQTFDVFTKLAK